MSKAKPKKIILEKDTLLNVSLKQRHPRGSMMLGGVKVFGGSPQLYKIPKGTDLSTEEVLTWFKIEQVKGESEAEQKKREAAELAAAEKEKADKEAAEKAAEEARAKEMEAEEAAKLKAAEEARAADELAKAEAAKASGQGAP